MAFSILIVISMCFLASVLIVIVPVCRWRAQVTDIFEQVQRDFKILEAIIKDIEEVAESAKKNRWETQSTLGFSTKTRSHCTTIWCWERLVWGNQNPGWHGKGLQWNLPETTWNKIFSGIVLLWFYWFQKKLWPQGWLEFVQFSDKWPTLEEDKNLQISRAVKVYC